MDVDLEAAVAKGTGKHHQGDSRFSTQQITRALGTAVPVFDELSDRELWVVFFKLQQYRLSRITPHEPPGHRR